MPGLIEENLAAYWLALASLADGEVHHEADVVWAYTGLPVLNRVVAARLDDATADARIGEVLAEFEKRRASVAWLVGPDARPADLRERLAAQGLEHVETLVGMELDLERDGGQTGGSDGAGWPEPPEGLDVREVVDDATRAAWLEVISAAFRLPASALDVLRRVSERMAEQSTTALAVPTSAPGTDGPWRSFVGYENGRPVTTATLVPAAGVAGVYLVGTLPKEARHGLGTALTLHVLRAARDGGQQRAVLQSTEAGKGMYAAIGFEARCRIAVYRRSGPANVLRTLLGRARRLGGRAAALIGVPVRVGVLAVGLAGCALLETGPQVGPPPTPTVTPRPTAVPPTPTPDPRGNILERRPPTAYLPAQINQIMPRLYQGGTLLPARLPVDQYFIKYVSTEPNGERIEILAQLFVPKVETATQMTVVVYGTGTTGLGDQCAPSLEQPTVRNWGDYQAHLLSYATQGYITIMADYAGFNDTRRLQRYFIAQSEARVLLDATRAVYKFFQDAPAGSLGTAAVPSKNVFYAGYSQGGHAAFAVRDEHTRYAPDVPVSGVIGHGGSMDLIGLMKDSPSFAPMLFYSLADHYGTTGPAAVDVSKLLAPRWMPSLALDMTTKCIDAMPGYYTNNHATVYTPAFNSALMGNRLAAEFPSVHEALERNSTGQAATNIPALVVQGSGDPIVTMRTQDAFVQRLCAAGQHINYVVYPGVHHYQIRQVGFRDTLSWMDAVARGSPPRSTCPGR